MFGFISYSCSINYSLFISLRPKNRPSSTNRIPFGSREAFIKQKKRKNILRLKKEEKIRLHLRRKEINDQKSNKTENTKNETTKVKASDLNDTLFKNKVQAFKSLMVTGE